jgi:hypothetical protein
VSSNRLHQKLFTTYSLISPCAGRQTRHATRGERRARAVTKGLGYIDVSAAGDASLAGLSCIAPRPAPFQA